MSPANCTEVNSPKFLRTPNCGGINTHGAGHGGEIHFWNFIANLLCSGQALAVLDCAKPTIVEHNEDYGQVMLQGDSHLLTIHEHATVASEDYNWYVGIAERYTDARTKPPSHAAEFA